MRADAGLETRTGHYLAGFVRLETGAVDARTFSDGRILCVERPGPRFALDARKSMENALVAISWRDREIVVRAGATMAEN